MGRDSSFLTVRDLLMPGEPLDPAEVVAGRSRLHNHVSWVVSLRPFPPAFPRLRGGELALVAAEHLARLDPPTTLADVVRQLLARNSAGVAVRGEVDRAAIEAAEAGGMPLLLLDSEAPLHDIEQAIMRECALYQARREMLPAGEDAWVEDLLAGRFSSAQEAQAAAQRHGHRPSAQYTVAYVRLPDAIAADGGPGGYPKVARELETRLKAAGRAAPPIVRPWEAGLAVLLPQGYKEDKVLTALAATGVPTGIGTEKPLLDAPESLAEAQLAAIASGLLRGREPACYARLGADRLLVLLYRDHPAQLEAFVDEALGPLLRYDEDSPTPVLPTLRAFIAHGGRLRETASDIYVHRNTLAYRLDRAAQILGADLKDPSTRLAIELALKALPLVGG